MAQVTACRATVGRGAAAAGVRASVAAFIVRHGPGRRQIHSMAFCLMEKRASPAPGEQLAS